jgi:hypothetical protein
LPRYARGCHNAAPWQGPRPRTLPGTALFGHVGRMTFTAITQEITRIRRLITRIKTGLDELTAAERDQIEQAVAVVRQHRAVMLGMPRIRQIQPAIRPGRTA